MICFPNIKINIGLDIISKRADGYHNIETVFFPVPYYDILEVLPSSGFEFINKGLKIDCPVEKNLCYKAYKLLSDEYKINPVKIILYKNISFGTGLGAGSSDAAFTLKIINDLYSLNLSDDRLLELASSIGADCAFFIKNRPLLATGTGNIFTEVELQLKNKILVLCIPQISVNTASAYKNCNPGIPEKKLSELIKLPVSQWKNNIKNDFETVVFKEFPVLNNIKQCLYDKGAEYVQMSGSGSAIFGIFSDLPENLEIKECTNLKVFNL
jgi:4-diphosphocytidyl-2-C-methyl-D-erythritol kinase